MAEPFPRRAGAPEVASFTELKSVQHATQGNLSLDAGLSRSTRFLGRKPLTRARLTAAGRKAFAEYLEAIGALVKTYALDLTVAFEGPSVGCEDLAIAHEMCRIVEHRPAADLGRG